MTHQSFKLIPGVDVNKTPALNEAAISQSQLIRFISDRTLGGLVQKLGGWTKYVSSSIGSTVRCLLGWQDVALNQYLAIGADGIAAGGGGSLEVVTLPPPYTNPTNNITDITPQTVTANVSVNFSTTSGSYIVTITDTGRNISQYDVVDIRVPVSIGGLVLFGLYQCYNPGFSTNTYEIYATNVLGNYQPATSTTTSAAVPIFTTISGQGNLTVTLNDHGYVVGDNFPVLVSTSVGGLTVFGQYTVTVVVDANNFQILNNNIASSSASASENGGQAQFVYYKGVGPIPLGTGYGIGGYGRGGYGTGVAPTASTGTPINAIDWTLDNLGSNLIACPLNGPIYEWTANSGQTVAQIIPEAPNVNAGMFIAMPQRQVVAWGSTFDGIQDPLLIRWSDVENYNQWIALLTNQAGSYRITRGSKIVQCIQAGQQGLVWTDLGIWSMQYAGPPYVYQFNEIGTGCGLIGRKAAASVNGNVYWMGQSQFFTMSGGGVTPLACPIWDVVFQDLDMNNLDRIRVAPNSRFGEIAWHFPTYGNGGENYGYIKYNFILNQWDYGFNSTANPYVARSAWINQSVLGAPIGAGLNQIIYQHETSPDADGVAMDSYFQTGYFALSEADVKMFVDEVWPDMKWGYYAGVQSANIKITFYTTDFPGQTPSQYGPYTVTQATTFFSPRMRARLMAIKIESNDIGSFWRLGNLRYRIQNDGRY